MPQTPWVGCAPTARSAGVPSTGHIRAPSLTTIVFFLAQYTRTSQRGASKEYPPGSLPPLRGSSVSNSSVSGLMPDKRNGPSGANQGSKNRAPGFVAGSYGRTSQNAAPKNRR